MEPGRAGGAGAADLLSGGSGDDTPHRARPPWLPWVSAAAVVAGLVVASPDLSLSGDRPGGAPSSRDTPGTQRPVARHSLDGVGWPARGDLAGDEEFMAGALARVRLDRPDATRVYYAGRLTDGSRIMLAGSDVRRGVVATSVHALHVPPQVPLVGGQVSEAVALVDPQQVLAWAVRGADDRVRVVVLTRPSPVRFELSGRVDFHRVDGSPSRRWISVAARDGVVVADLGTDVDPIVAVRASGPAVFSLPLVVRVVTEFPADPIIAVSGTGDEGYRGPDARRLSRALRAQAGSVVDLRTASASVLWSGSWLRRRLALVLLERPDGTRFQALVGQEMDREFPAGVRALPAGAPDRLPWLLEPFSAQDPTLLLCPTGDGTLLYRRDGQPTRTMQIGADGVVSLVDPGPSPPSASGAEVTLLDTTGRVLLTTLLPKPGFDNPLAMGRD